MKNKNQSKSPTADPIDQFLANCLKDPKVIIISVAILGLLIAWYAWPTWEDKNYASLMALANTVIDHKDENLESTYVNGQDLLDRVKNNRIKSTKLIIKINEVKEIVSEIKPKVIDKIDAREKQTRMNEEEAKRQDAEKLEQADRMANEEKKRLVQMEKYKNVSQDAKDALVALKKLQAFTEIGVTKFKYNEALGDAWGSIKIFVESPRGKGDYSDLSEMFVNAIDSYKGAVDVWDVEMGPQGYWSVASIRIKEIDDLINQH